MSSAYLSLLIFLTQSWFQLVLHPAQPFVLMYSAYKLNKQDDNIQPWCTPFPIWNQSVVPCLVATWPAYRFLRRQVNCSGIPISLRIFHSVVFHTVKAFSTVFTKLHEIFNTSLQNVSGESGDITLPTKVCLVKTMVYSVVMYRCDYYSCVLGNFCPNVG